MPPYLGFHIVFNVKLLYPYFHLYRTHQMPQNKPTKLDLDYTLPTTTTDQIFDTRMKDTQNQDMSLYGVSR